MELDTLLQSALNHAYHYLKFRPRTKKEITSYLHKKAEKYNWSQEVIEQAILKLEEREYINDPKFVQWFVEQRDKSKPKSEFILRNELLRLGINKETLNSYFIHHPTSEGQLAEHALSTRWHQLKQFNQQHRFQKAASFLTRRGFPFDLVKKTIAKMEEKE